MINVEYIVRVDGEGRIELPANIREKLKLKEGGRVIVKLDGSRVVISPISQKLEEKVQEWRKLVLSLHPPPFTEKVENSWKWMSSEYAKRKLGAG